MPNSLRAVPPAPRKRHDTGWMLLILLAAAAFRLVAMSNAPPGMTHDEADHGLTAIGIREGVREIYFTIGYGREPLYDYATAAVMSGMGESYLAGRLTSAYFSLILIAGTYAWLRRAFGRPTALLAAAGLAVGFWPIMAGRQALRSIALPALFVLSVFWFWYGLERLDNKPDAAGGRRRVWAAFALAGLLLGLTVYTYIPARILWLILPVLVVYLMVVRRSWLARAWAGLGTTLLAALLVAAPLISHLRTNPGLEVRVTELSAPLQAAAAGDFGPLWTNIAGGLQLFTVAGDPAWRYNIAGQPWLGPVVGVLFYAGVALAVWLAAGGLLHGMRRLDERAGSFLALVWLLAGLSPALVTGPELATTQAIGLLPVLYLFPALALVSAYRPVERWWAGGRGQAETLRRAAVVVALLLVIAGAYATARNYFGRWATHPEVRVQYESALITALRHLDESGGGAATISTITPGQFHSAAVARLLPVSTPDALRWFDGRESFLLPAAEDAVLVVPGFAPLAGVFAPYLSPEDSPVELPLPPDDLDRPLMVYQLDGSISAGSLPPQLAVEAEGMPLPARFGDAAELAGYDISEAVVAPGDKVQVVTAWRLLRPFDGAMLFSQVLDPEGPIAQADRLGAPGDGWRAGDLLLQLHTLTIPPETAPGVYPVITGLYTGADGRRLTVGDSASDYLTLDQIEVRAP